MTPEVPVDPAIEPRTREPFWGFTDVAVIVVCFLPALFVSARLALGAGRFLPVSKAFLLLLVNIIQYVLLALALLVVFRVRYQRPFWRSLGWRVPFPHIASVAIGGVALVMAVGILGRLLRAPEISFPMGQFLKDRPTIVLISLLVVIFGPAAEELAFRGFLQPLLIRWLGVVGGIVLTGALFGSLHGYEYQWSWRHMLLISLAGVTFGWVRHRLRSTAASALMHSTFNLTQLAAFMALNKPTW